MTTAKILPLPPDRDPAGNRPDLSVIVVTHNNRELLRACLDSITRNTHGIRVEVIVVDNRSSDGTGEMVRRDYPGVLYHYRNEPFSFTRANNEGMLRARGRFLFLLNEDTELRNDALDRIVRYFDHNPHVGVVGPKLLNGDGTIQFSCRNFPSFTTALFNRYSFLTRFFPSNRFSSNYLMTDFGHAETRPVDWVSGAAIAVRREAVEHVGLLDERIISFTEDVDWCYRMHEAGWQVIYLHEAVITHYIGMWSQGSQAPSAARRRVPWRLIYIRNRSILYFYFKHYSKNILFIDAAVTVGVALRAAVEILRKSILR